MVQYAGMDAHRWAIPSRQRQPTYNVFVVIPNERTIEYQRLGAHQQRRHALGQHCHLSIGQRHVPDGGLGYGAAVILNGCIVNPARNPYSIQVGRCPVGVVSSFVPTVQKCCPRRAVGVNDAGMVPGIGADARCRVRSSRSTARNGATHDSGCPA